jgi:CRP/FNR family transcriptional regulator, dissimilatory nitrate respiration regulator
VSERQACLAIAGRSLREVRGTPEFISKRNDPFEMKRFDADGSLFSRTTAGSESAQRPTEAASPANPSPRASRLRSLFTGSVRRFSPGARIFWPGEPARNLFFLATGLVKLTDVSIAGGEIIVHLYQPGEIFGERCFLQAAQQYCATALEQSDVLETSASGLIERVRSRPDTLLELLGELSGRLAATDGEFQTFVSETVVVRLGAKLLALASVSDTASDWLDLPHGFRHEEFAQMLGVHRETVTRAIANLKRLGVVATVRRGPIRIHRSEMRRFLRGQNSGRVMVQQSMSGNPFITQHSG